jgi:hypothetical protein
VASCESWNRKGQVLTEALSIFRSDPSEKAVLSKASMTSPTS